MFSVKLVNMPHCSLFYPAIGLTQLKAVTEQQVPEADIQLLYLNNDFAKFIGADAYIHSVSAESITTALGDWFFRPVVFAEAPDNSAQYLDRYYPRNTARNRLLRRIVRHRQAQLDAFLDDLVQRYRLHETDIVGLSTMFVQNMACLALAKKIRAAGARPKILLGGANCAYPMGWELKRSFPYIDYVFSGPALLNFPRFVQHRMTGDEAACDRLDGVFSAANLEHVRQPACGAEPAEKSVAAYGPRHDMEMLPELNYDEFLDTLARDFSGKGEADIHFQTSQGCWWGEKAACTFCSLNDFTYTAMSLAKAIRHINRLFERYSARCKRFVAIDDIMPRNYPQEVLPYLETPAGVGMYYDVKSNLSEEAFANLHKAHVIAVEPGIEALATSTLKLMKKGATAFQNILFLKRCLKYDVYPFWHLLVGFPEEQEPGAIYRKYLGDIPNLMHLPPPTGVYAIQYQRDSHYFAEAQRYNLDLYPEAYYAMIYPLPEEAVRNIAFYFVDRNQLGRHELIPEVRRLCEVWWQRWNRPDGTALFPELYLEASPHSGKIRDSRSGEAREYDLTALETEILRVLDEPQGIKALHQLVGKSNNNPAALESVLQTLQDKGLIFEERERFLSVAMAGRQKPLTMLDDSSEMLFLE